MTDLSGEWHSYYRYPSTSRGDEDFWGRHTLTAVVSGHAMHLESTPESESQLIMELTLSEDGHRAEGTWREETDPHGYYHGDIYEGTVKLELTEDGRRLKGMWYASGKEGKAESDIWELTREGTDKSEQKDEA